MANSTGQHDARIADVRMTDSAIEVVLRDGRRLGVPLDHFPWLASASEAARTRWEIGAGGYGVVWPDLEEEIGVLGLLRAASAG
jgi:hypothetical protein